MKILFGLSLITLLLSGCSSGENDRSENALYERYNDEAVELDDEGNQLREDAEEEPADSIGPTDIPADLVPSR